VKATRDHFGQALVDVAADSDAVVVVNCDLASATKTATFKTKFPDRFFECGIAEANGIGIASGLAQEGYRPFVASFGHFLSGKYLEIFQSVGLNDSGVVMVGTHAGLAIGKDGPTQMGLRDLSLMRTLPNLEVLQPADGIETRAMLKYLVRSDRPSYLRLCRQPQEEVHSQDYHFTFGVPDVVHPGSGDSLVVFTMGGMVQVLLDALPALADNGVDPLIVNVSSLPVKSEAVREIVSGHPRVFVIEDHFITGGLADEIGGLLLRAGASVQFGSWGVPDYGQAGSPDELYERYQLDVHGVTTLITNFAMQSLTVETRKGL
jgi:transketolase